MKTEEKAMADKIRVLLTEEEVDAKINEIAAKISEGYAGKADSPDLHFKGRRIFHL